MVGKKEELIIELVILTELILLFLLPPFFNLVHRDKSSVECVFLVLPIPAHLHLILELVYRGQVAYLLVLALQKLVAVGLVHV